MTSSSPLRAIVTGHTRGLGAALAEQLLARNVTVLGLSRSRHAHLKARFGAQLEEIELSLAEPARVAQWIATNALRDFVSGAQTVLLINNAGIARLGSLMDEGALDALRDHFETNVFGMLAMSRAFAGKLASNGGGAILNVLSVASWVNRPILAGYGVSKSAAWGLTNGLRHSLREQRTQVVGLHAGFIDTDLTRGLEVPKATPDDVVRQAYDAIEAGAEEVSTDEFTRQVKAGLSAGVYLDEPAPR